MKETQWASLSVRETLEKIHSDEHTGLHAMDVEHRRADAGFNILASEKGLSAITVFVSQFKSALIYILLIAAASSKSAAISSNTAKNPTAILFLFF